MYLCILICGQNLTILVRVLARNGWKSFSTHFSCQMTNVVCHVVSFLVHRGLAIRYFSWRGKKDYQVSYHQSSTFLPFVASTNSSYLILDLFTGSESDCCQTYLHFDPDFQADPPQNCIMHGQEIDNLNSIRLWIFLAFL